MHWNTITVGIDDTLASKRALRRAADLAIAAKARLVVTSVAPVLPGMAASKGIGPFDPADPPEAHERELRNASDSLAVRGVEAELYLGMGEPAATIVEVADKYDSDLIVVGRRRPSFLHRLFGSSVSRAVARKAHCDVLIVG